MQNINRFFHLSCLSIAAACLTISFTGCQSNRSTGEDQSPAPMSGAVSTAPVVATPAPEPAPQSGSLKLPVRINAGRFDPYTDSQGNVWLPDQGFDGETIERDPALPISNTTDSEIYRTERYSMESFAYPVPNGRYTVKLHFAETFEGIFGPGERVFSYNVEGKQFNDFDIWAKTGGAQRAYIETVPVEVTDGKLDITFTRKEENPEINGIEILPRP